MLPDAETLHPRQDFGREERKLIEIIDQTERHPVQSGVGELPMMANVPRPLASRRLFCAALPGDMERPSARVRISVSTLAMSAFSTA